MTPVPESRSSRPHALRAALAAFAIALMALAAVSGAGAQDAPLAPAAVLERARGQLDQIEATLKRTELDDQALADLRERVEPISVDVQRAVEALAPQLAAADARLAQVGAKPAEGAPPESADVTRERDAQTANRQTIDEAQKRGRLLLVEAVQVGDQITQRRRDLLAQRLFERSRSLIDPTLWTAVVAELPRDIRSIGLLTSDWGAVIARRSGLANIATVAVSVGFALFLLLPLRRWIRRVTRSFLIARAPTTRLRKSLAATSILLAATLAPLLAALVIYWGFKTVGWLPSRLDRLAVAVIWAFGFVGFVQGLAYGVLAPGSPQWRLPNLSDAAVAELKNQPLWCALTLTLGRVFDVFNDTVNASFPASIATNGAFALLNVAAFAMALRRIRAAEKIEIAQDPEGAGKMTRPLLSLARMVAWLAIMVVIAAVAVGYVALAQFLANQVIWIATLLSLLYLLLVLADDLFTFGLNAETGLGKVAAETVGIRAESLEQIGVVLSGLVRVGLIGLAAMVILAPWGLQSTDVMSWLRLAMTGLSFGDIHVSIPGILGAVLLVVVGFALTRAVQRWLDKDLLPKTRMDTGLRASINTGVGYLGGLIVIVVAVSYLGFSLDRLAIVAGALSVGIGFGLQAVISNFVSGVILLAERPIKAGDWIVIGTDQGNVRRISVRSTEIELFDRSTLIVPNSDFITKSVKNVTHGAPVGRVQIELSVAADADPAQMREIMLGCARAHGSVLTFPEPQVFFTAMGKSDNTFALFASVKSPRQAAAVKSDLNFMLVKAFKAAGVPIAGAAAPSMVEAVDRIGEALARAGFGGGGIDRAGPPEPGRHDASAAPTLAEAPPEPQSGSAVPATKS